MISAQSGRAERRSASVALASNRNVVFIIRTYTCCLSTLAPTPQARGITRDEPSLPPDSPSDASIVIGPNDPLSKEFFEEVEEFSIEAVRVPLALATCLANAY